MIGNDRVPATVDMARDLGSRLRKSDRDEIAAASGLIPEESIVLCVKVSKRSDAWLVNGVPAAIAGVADSFEGEGIGRVWMLASDEAEKFPKRLLQGNREYVQELLEGYQMLSNFVDDRNKKAQRWLSWLGFTIGDPVPYGLFGLPFRPFWMFRSGVSSVTRQDTVNPSYESLISCVEVKNV